MPIHRRNKYIARMPAADRQPMPVGPPLEVVTFMVMPIPPPGRQGTFEQMLEMITARDHRPLTHEELQTGLERGGIESYYAGRPIACAGSIWGRGSGAKFGFFVNPPVLDETLGLNDPRLWRAHPVGPLNRNHWLFAVTPVKAPAEVTA
jgi:hypothetical protein